MAKAQKFRASKVAYVSEKELTLGGFETPFSKTLRMDNRWVKLANKIPWDTLAAVYYQTMSNDSTGAGGINPRVAIGSLIIKHMCNLSDRDTIQHIQENVYMQYFLGYSSFSDEAPFDSSLFVDLRKRLDMDRINEINERILGLTTLEETKDKDDESNNDLISPESSSEETKDGIVESPITHMGKLITDATACPQDIAFPTDLNLLNDAREKVEELIDHTYDPSLHGKKPRTYREKARKDYLHTAQKKVKSRKEIRQAIRKQLGYLRRDIRALHNQLDHYSTLPFNKQEYKYFLTVQTLYDQQSYMHNNRVHSVEDRIVSIHQPHVRPIVRGKANAFVEFGAKVQVSLMNGFAFLDEFSWDAFNEGSYLLASVEKYKVRFGYYPEEVMADKIYCNRFNRAALKNLGIKLRAKPLGRPRAVDVEHVRPGERNPIEGTFGTAKSAYGLNRIKARLSQTSESWIATIILVLNLVKLAGKVPLSLYQLIVKAIIEVYDSIRQKPATVSFLHALT